MGKQGIAPDRVEFAENIVDEKQRRRSFLEREQLRLRGVVSFVIVLVLVLGQVPEEESITSRSTSTITNLD